MYICSFGKSRSSNYVSGPVDIYRTKSIPRVTPQASEELLKERICNFSLKAASFQSFFFFFHVLFNMHQLVRRRNGTAKTCMLFLVPPICLSDYFRCVVICSTFFVGSRYCLLLWFFSILLKKVGFCFIKNM